MSNLLEDALLDIEQMKKVVEEDAKNKLVESMTPKIRKFINDRLYEEAVPMSAKDKEELEDKEVLTDQAEVGAEEEAITYEEDAETGEEVAVLDLDELKTRDEKEDQVVSIDDIDDDEEVEVNLEELRNVLSKFKGDKRMNLKDLFLKEEKEQCEGCGDEHADESLQEMEGDEEIIEVDENELKEAIKKMKAKRRLNEDEIVLDIDVDAEGAIEDVEVVSVGEEGVEGEEGEEEFDLGDLEGLGDEEGGEEGEFEFDMEGGEEGEEVVPEEGGEEEPVVNVEEEEEEMSVEESKLRRKIRKMIRETYRAKAKRTKRTKRTKRGIKEDVELEVGSDVKVSIDTGSGGGDELGVELTAPEEEIEMVEPEELAGPEEMEENKKLKVALRKAKKKVVESNLMNAKLVYANKLLMNNSITKTQRVEIIESLDNAKSLREVQLVYKALTNKSSKRKRVTEGRKVLAGGSSATPTRAKKDELKEGAGVEVSHWQKLAGIK